MRYNFLDKIIKKYLKQETSSVESKILDDWFDNIEYKSDETWSKSELLEIKSRVLAIGNKRASKSSKLFRLVGAIAALLTLIGGFSYYFIVDSSKVSQPIYSLTESDTIIHVGGVQGTLYAGPNLVDLHDLKIDSIYQIDNIGIQRIAEDEIVVLTTSVTTVKQLQLRVPKGGNFKVNLIDGTKLTMNSDSYLEFPSVFEENVRRVKVEGEVFFEVSKDINKREFVVDLGETSIVVLGTKFNISYYPGTMLKASLFEGKIRVDHEDFTVGLVPGEEVIVNSTGKYNVRTFNQDNVAAWKEGYFSLDDKNIVEIMDEVSKWYNIDVEYHTDNLAQRYYGSISKFSDINTLLETLSLANGHQFEIIGRRVLVK